MKRKTPNILTIDVETYPDTVMMYGKTHEPVIVKILEFGGILSMSYKINNSKTRYIGLNTIKGYKKGDLNDKKLLIEITKIISDEKIDYINGQNSDDFDIKKIKERLIFHKLPPLPDIATLDTLKLYNKVTKLQNKKLNTISQFNGIGQKVSHSGTELFIACGNGDPKAWKINEKYNKKDVDLAWENLKIVLPYVTLTTKQTTYNENIQCQNPTCLSRKMKHHKNKKVVGGWRAQYQCDDCGCYTTDKKLIKK